MKSKSKTDWEARFACEKPLTIKTLNKGFADIPAGSTMLIVTPKMVDAVVRALPKGTVVEQKEIRRTLSNQFGANSACPVTTGISLRVVAERAYLELAKGVAESNITPFWRAVSLDSDLAQKLTCGTDYLSRKQGEERA